MSTLTDFGVIEICTIYQRCEGEDSKLLQWVIEAYQHMIEFDKLRIL